MICLCLIEFLKYLWVVDFGQNGSARAKSPTVRDAYISSNFAQITKKRPTLCRAFQIFAMIGVTTSTQGP